MSDKAKIVEVQNFYDNMVELLNNETLLILELEATSNHNNNPPAGFTITGEILSPKVQGPFKKEGNMIRSEQSGLIPSIKYNGVQALYKMHSTTYTTLFYPSYSENQRQYFPGDNKIILAIPIGLLETLKVFIMDLLVNDEIRAKLNTALLNTLKPISVEIDLISDCTDRLVSFLMSDQFQQQMTGMKSVHTEMLEPN